MVEALGSRSKVVADAAASRRRHCATRGRTTSTRCVVRVRDRRRVRGGEERGVVFVVLDA